MQIEWLPLLFLSFAFALIIAILSDGGSGLECSNLPTSYFHSIPHHSVWRWKYALFSLLLTFALIIDILSNGGSKLYSPCSLLSL